MLYSQQVEYTTCLFSACPEIRLIQIAADDVICCLPPGCVCQYADLESSLACAYALPDKACLPRMFFFASVVNFFISITCL